MEKRRREGDEKQQHIREVQTQMERASELRKRGILNKEAEHEAVMSRINDAKRSELARSQTEKDMRQYAMQLKLARSQRKDDYHRQMVSEKIRLESMRADDLKQHRQKMLAERRDMRNRTVQTRQALTDQLAKMRQSSNFSLPPEMLSYVQNPDLLELLDRCESRAKETGSKVSMGDMKDILDEMLAEGKGMSLIGEKKGRGEASSASLARPATAPTL